MTNEQDALPGEAELRELLHGKLRARFHDMWIHPVHPEGLAEAAMEVLWPILEHEVHKVAELQQLLLTVAARLGAAAAEARDARVDAEVARLTAEAYVEPRD